VLRLAGNNSCLACKTGSGCWWFCICVHCCCLEELCCACTADSCCRRRTGGAVAPHRPARGLCAGLGNGSPPIRCRHCWGALSSMAAACTARFESKASVALVTKQTLLPRRVSSCSRAMVHDVVSLARLFCCPIGPSRMTWPAAFGCGHRNCPH
jgi:hypothetical protein